MFLSPMLLQRTHEPLHQEGYISELKLDGIRLIYSNMERLKLYTRHNNNVTQKFPELWDAGIPKGTILDGELIMTDHKGHPDFEAIQSRFQVSNTMKIQRLSKSNPVHFCAFDVMYHEGQSVMKLPLMERKQILDSIIQDNERVSKVRWLKGNGSELFALCQEQGLEGIVQKKADSIYEKDRRSHSWQKVINYQYEDVFVIGYRKKEFGWILGKVEKDVTRPIGVTEFVPPQARRELYQIAEGCVSNETEEVVYLKPSVCCTVKYRNYTKAGLLRMPVFVKFVQ
jgi:DNA ligase 1